MKHNAIVLACVLNLPRRSSRRGRELVARIHRAAEAFTPIEDIGHKPGTSIDDCDLADVTRCIEDLAASLRRARASKHGDQ